MADNIIEKIKKLLALANDGAATENEAMVAMLKAQKLMAENGVGESDLGSGGNKIVSLPVTDESVPAGGRYKKYRVPLALAICRSYRCECYLMGNELCILGFEQDVKIALEVYRYAYAFILRTGNKICRERLKMYGECKGVLESYARGFCSGLMTVLGKQSKDLAIVVPNEVKNKLEEIATGRKSAKYNPEAIDSRSYLKGIEDGKAFFSTRMAVGA